MPVERPERRARVAIVNFRAARIVRDVIDADEERAIGAEPPIPARLPDDKPPPSHG